MGPGDWSIPEGQQRICTEKVRDSHDVIVVQEKLDGSCVAVALIDDAIHPLIRAGWPADSSPYEQHHLFAQWVRQNEDRFRVILKNGERLCGEWLAQAHGTVYDLNGREPFAVFDLMIGDRRISYDALHERIDGHFSTPSLLHVGDAIGVEKALEIHSRHKWPCDEIEGVVYRCERRGQVEFLAKYVRPDKKDGKYLPEMSGAEAVWNWHP